MKHFSDLSSPWRAAMATLWIGAPLFGVMPAEAAGPSPAAIRNIVLVHGAWVDGSGWEAVYQLLTAKGFRVSIVQHPLTSLAADVAATRAVLDRQEGPAVLVGHSYGGAVVTEAGQHPAVARLVYLAAFAPDKGESVQTLVANPPPGAAAPPILPPINGSLLLDRQQFAAAFGADLPPGRAAFLANAQVPWGLEAFGGTVSEAAWKSRPSWYLVATQDRMIPPVAQRHMAERMGAVVQDVRTSHAVYESNPEAVAEFIEQAARGK